MVDPFFRKYKWIRYTYDFGNDWCHKIMIEKIDETYQDTMYAAGCLRYSDALEALWDYKKQNNIRSEEFLYILCDACITFGKEEDAESLLKELEKGTVSGKAAAKVLRDKQQERHNQENGFDEDDLFYPWMNAKPQTPFVRESPKIGRNDPCPCGSGKKYKKCCGK